MAFIASEPLIQLGNPSVASAKRCKDDIGCFTKVYQHALVQNGNLVVRCRRLHLVQNRYHCFAPERIDEEPFDSQGRLTVEATPLLLKSVSYFTTARVYLPARRFV